MENEFCFPERTLNFEGLGMSSDFHISQRTGLFDDNRVSGEPIRKLENQKPRLRMHVINRDFCNERFRET